MLAFAVSDDLCNVTRKLFASNKKYIVLFRQYLQDIAESDPVEESLLYPLRKDALGKLIAERVELLFYCQLMPEKISVHVAANVFACETAF